MKKVLICSLHNAQKLKQLLLKYNLSIVNKNPDFILVYGGDGTILFAERHYPSITKLVIKKNGTSGQYDYTFENLKVVLPKLRAGKFKIKKEMKLEANFHGRKLIALNEIQLHTKLPIRAVRFSLSVGKKLIKNIIGDGAVISTPFGSSAYYSSAGGRPFNRGIGVCLNNPHNKKIRSFTVSDNSKIRVKITRDNAWLAADNDEKLISLKSGDAIKIRKSKNPAKFIRY